MSFDLETGDALKHAIVPQQLSQKRTRRRRPYDGFLVLLTLWVLWLFHPWSQFVPFKQPTSQVGLGNSQIVQSSHHHTLLHPFNFSLPTKHFYSYPGMPEKDRHKLGSYFQSTSVPFKVCNASLTFLRASSLVFITVRTAEEGEETSALGEEDETMVQASVRWPEIDDWDMEEWGRREMKKMVGGKAVLNERKGALGAVLEIPPQSPPFPKPGRPGPRPNMTYFLLSAELTLIVPSTKFYGRDLDISRYPNTDEGGRTYAPTEFKIKGEGVQWGDVSVELELGSVGTAYPLTNYTLIAKSVSMTIRNPSDWSLGWIYGSFAISDWLNLTVDGFGSVNANVLPHPSSSSQLSLPSSLSPSHPLLHASPNISLLIGQGTTFEPRRGGDISLNVHPDVAWSGTFDARTKWGDMDVDVRRKMEVERVGLWEGGNKQGVGFEFVAEVLGGGEGRMELMTEEGVVGVRIG